MMHGAETSLRLIYSELVMLSPVAGISAFEALLSSTSDDHAVYMLLQVREKQMSGTRIYDGKISLQNALRPPL